MPKSDGNVRICVDLVELNKNVMRELHPLPKAEYTLNLLAGAKTFSKLDANSGFWQIPLEKSRPISPHLSPRLVDLDSKDYLSVSPQLQNISKEECLRC